jgi:hypothetical protein
MNQRNSFFLMLLAVLALSACVKTEIIPETLEPKLGVLPASVSLTVSQTFQLTGTYTDEAGEDQSAQIQWNTADPSVASVSAGGLLTAKAPGQTWAVATASGGLADSTLVTVTSDPDAVAKVVITISQTVLTVGAMLQFSAKAYNNSDQELAGKIVTWASSNLNVLTVSASGLATGQTAGTASVTASVAGVKSLPSVIQVQPVGGSSRTGTFSGNMGYSVSGTATLQQTGNTLKLILNSNFQASNGPMLGVYLAKNASGALNSQNSLKLANLIQNSGTQEYNVPAGVGLNDYDYVVIYCIPFTVRFGTAQLNN